MNNKTLTLFGAAALLMVAAVALVCIGFVGQFPTPAPALAVLGGGVISFIVALVLTHRALRGVGLAESVPVLRTIGGWIAALAGAVTIYAAILFFMSIAFPPNTLTSRLPSLYLMLGGIIVLIVGMALRSLRFR